MSRSQNINYNPGSNLPNEIMHPEGIIQNQYTLSGQKIGKKLLSPLGSLIYKEHYYGDLVVKDGQPSRILHRDGVVNLSDNGVEFNYHLKDHLGNVRVVITPDGNLQPNILQVNDYYPFGMVYTTDAGANKYLYNSKEEQEMPGKWLDYGARFYDPQIARFHSVDPHAENYLPVSPYAYVGNNPILMIDPDGRDWYRHDETGAVVWRNSTDETITRNNDEYTNVGGTYQFDIDGVAFVMFQTGDAGSFEVHTIEMFENPTGLGIRNDPAGEGHFGASRDGGSRPHMGLDILSVAGQDKVAPFSGETVTLQPSGGVGISTTAPTGAQVFVGYTYTTNNVGRSQADRGDVVGSANNMTVNYSNPQMQNHVHVQLRVNGQLVDPAPFYFRQ